MQAWDWKHLTSAVRTYRMQVLHAVLRSLVLHKMDDVFAMATFGANTGPKLLGITTMLVFVFMANIEARAQLMARYPGAVLRLVERALSTDDLECEFSTIVTGCGFKPQLEMVLGYLEHVDYLHLLRRRQHALGIVLPKSSKGRYAYHTANQLRDAAWNDGLYVQQPSGPQLAGHLLMARNKCRNTLGLKRATAIRAFHKNK